MNTGYTPEQGRGFVRPGETKKPCYRVFSGIKKAAPIRNRLSEQLTCCEKNGSVQGNYINRVVKRHYCRITGKTKATAKESPVGTRENKSITNNATFAAGGQCNQSGSVRCHTCNERFSLYSLRNCSRAKAHGANLSDSCSIFLRRLFRVGDNVLVNSLSVIVLSCIAMRRNTLHHGAGDGYSCSLALRRWRRLISPLTAVTINCALLSPSSKFFSKSATTSCGNLAFNCCDLLFVEPVAITESSLSWCDSVYTKKISEKGLKCDSLIDRLKPNGAMHQTTTPRSGGTHAGRLTTNDRKRIEAAMRNYTRHPQGRDSYNLNKYIWRFIALSTAQPRVITIEATSEQEARQQSPAGCVMVFAARIRQGEHHD
ncbi:TPA: host cell division inhibitor Icd-like protein [Escherichia coli]|nr:host cell division inhibitor Icd-like protein [Escherichia coli]